MIILIDSNSFNINKKEVKKRSFTSKFLYSILVKSLIVVVLFLASLIYIKQSDKNKNNFKNIVYNNSLSFAKIYNVYKKYLGDVIPFKNIFKDNTKLVSNEKLTYNSISKKDNGYILGVSNNYTISSISSGIVIERKEDSNYINIVTVQDKNGLNITYGILNNINVKLYDYVEKGEIIGQASDKLYLSFKKDNKYLSYEEVLK